MAERDYAAILTDLRMPEMDGQSGRISPGGETLAASGPADGLHHR